MSTVPPRQLWALAVSGVLTELNDAHHNELGSWGQGDGTIGWCTRTLSSFYGVDSAESFASTVDWLWSTGHSSAARAALAALPADPAEDDAVAAMLRAHRAEIERAGLLAWDLGRLVAVVGWGFWAGYVPEMDAWTRLLVAAYRCQQAYDSWASFGAAYERGRLFWSQGKLHDGTAAALRRLLEDDDSPWRTLPWNLDLGITIGQAPGAAKVRYKRSVCAHCGGTKQRPSATAYVYCDFCGELSDYDFLRACDAGAARPGPAYEQLAAELAPELAAAVGAGDRAAYHAVQVRLYTAFAEMCPKAGSPRLGDPAYRAAYAAYMAEAATLAAFDAEAVALDAQMNQSVARLVFVQVDGKPKVVTATFDAMAESVFARQAHLDALHEAAGLYVRQPDHAPAELQRRIGWSLFAQGWLPYLEEAAAAALLARTGLAGDYLVAEPVHGDPAACGTCAATLELLDGARCVVCEHCGHRVDAAGTRVQCQGCGLTLAPPEAEARFDCPACATALHTASAPPAAAAASQ